MYAKKVLCYASKHTSGGGQNTHYNCTGDCSALVMFWGLTFPAIHCNLVNIYTYHLNLQWINWVTRSPGFYQDGITLVKYKYILGAWWVVNIYFTRENVHDVFKHVFLSNVHISWQVFCVFFFFPPSKWKTLLMFIWGSLLKLSKLCWFSIKNVFGVFFPQVKNTSFFQTSDS